MDGVVTTALLGASVCLPTVVAVCLFSNRVRDLLPGGRGCVCVKEERREKKCVPGLLAWGYCSGEDDDF